METWTNFNHHLTVGRRIDDYGFQRQNSFVSKYVLFRKTCRVIKVCFIETSCIRDKSPGPVAYW